MLLFKDGANLTVNGGVFFNTNPSLNLQLRLQTTNATNDAKINVNNLTLDGTDVLPTVFTNSGFNKLVLNIKLGGFQDFVNSQPDVILDNADVSSNRDNTPMLFNSGSESHVAEVVVKSIVT